MVWHQMSPYDQSRLGSLDSTSQRQILCASKDNQYQQTALMRAVQSGLRSCVELFLSVDVEINDLDKTVTLRWTWPWLPEKSIAVNT
jgi:hypothetical protein